MATGVDSALVGHKGKSRKIYELVSSTSDLEKEIERLLGAPIATKIISQTEESKIKEILEQLCFVAVVGERNCGKSSLINALLGRKAVPVSDTTCTSRVVCIKYSEEPYVKLVDIEGATIEVSNSVKRLVVLDGEDRENEELVSQMVEVGQNHLLLLGGSQIVDSPGRSENKILDQVVDRFALERDLSVLIYVIDGNFGLRPADKASIQFFKDKCPDARLVYVCNKVDEDRRAKDKDQGSDEESDDGSKPYVDKGHDVSQRLREYSLLDDSSTKDIYYAISTREVNKVIRKSTGSLEDDVIDNNKFLRDFVDCKVCLTDLLKERLNKHMLSAIQILSECHSRCFSSFSWNQQNIDMEGEEMNKAVEAARSSEKRLFNHLVQAVDEKADKIKETMVVAGDSVVKNITTINFKEQEIVAYDHVLSQPDVISKYGKKLPRSKEFLKLHAFCHEIRNFIVNKVSREVETGVEGLLEEVAEAVWPSILETMEVLDSPTLKRNLDSIYQFFGAENNSRENTCKSLAGLVFSLLRAAKSALSFELQRTYGMVSMVDVAFEMYKKKAKPKSKQPVVAKALIEKLNPSKVADAIVSACREAMTKSHQQFEKSMREIEMLKQQIQEQKQEHLGAIRSKVIFELAQIEIRNRALEFEIARGEPEFGKLLSRGAHSDVYQLEQGWKLSEPEQYVVRVVRGGQDDLFKQILCNLYCAYNCKESEYLTRIVGWLLPTSDVLHIIMEKVATSLDPDTLSPRQRLEVTLDVVKGLDVIHSSGFFYNNLKASNILMTEDKRAKIDMCKGKCEHLHSQAANFDIQQVGELLLELFGGEVIERSPSAASSMRMRKPTDCPRNVMMLINRCVARHKQITIKDIITELQAMLG